MPESDKEVEQREHPRQPIELKVEYKQLNTFFSDYTKNISKGGTFIHTERLLPVGTEFLFQLVLPGEPLPLQIRGEVQHVVEPREDLDRDAVGMGIRFVYHDSKEREQLEKTVEGDHGGQPRAAPICKAHAPQCICRGAGRVMSSEARTKRALRYLAPNLITAANIVFGMMSLVAAYEGRYVDAGWLIIYSVLTDRLDGFVARLVRGTSELGVQLDSFADFISFGVAPAMLFYSAFAGESRLEFAQGSGRYVLLAGCICWILAATFRLARYNITTGDPGHPKIFFGVPTTMVGGLLVIWFLALLKYTPMGTAMHVPPFGGARIFDGIWVPAVVWHYFPGLLFVGAYLMASTLRMPKLGLMRSKSVTAFVFTNVFLGYLCGYVRIFPEYMVWLPTAWLVIFLIWGQLSPAARKMKPPPLFPAVDPPPGTEPIRPEDDLLPEGHDEPLDPDEEPHPSDSHSPRAL